MGVHLSANLGKKSVLFLMKNFFFGFHVNLGKKVFCFDEDLFFWSSREFREKSVPFLMKNFFCLYLNWGKKVFYF